ncbi:hypothetical protein [Streptomyces sp. MP131-18]|uniref:hypothetical protein n=1 Tax=Streptomyces sp. MP131-18 TaxID=1857892 RepID=UPI00097C2F5A|nr:hypothetical protein [Streptomyces sp. MP131-18]ONK09465.1 hypothetical protein STBA_01650 [Streptomyces sp. MP131-18]
MGRSQQPSEHLAQTEQERADNLADYIDQIQSRPDHPSAGSLPHYQAAYRNASSLAAQNTAQPGGRS